MTGMKGSELKKKISQGQRVLGTWLSISDPAIARMYTQLGYDFLIIDMEHSALNPETMQRMLLMFSDTPTCPLVRVPWHEPNWSKWALDAGAEGILFPNVTSAELARQLVAQCKYPPEGERGFFPKTASNFLMNLPEYMQDINERILVWIQIEHVDGLHNLDEIAQVPGLDALFIGPADLSFSLGIGNQYDHPEFDAALERIFAGARKAGVPVAYHMYEISEKAIQKGKAAQIFTFGFDILYARLGALQALEQVRKTLQA
jgi:2-keto-3-deoxy-L-rhamnonate aldolase RhmA